MSRSSFITTIAIGSLMLASCQSSNSRTPNLGLSNSTPVATEPVGLNGTWIPTDEKAKGVYVATFRDSVFVSKSPKDQKVLAKGSYSIVSETAVKLQFEGAATKTVVNADCERKTTETLYCIPSIGSPFNLRRTG